MAQYCNADIYLFLKDKLAELLELSDSVPIDEDTILSDIGMDSLIAMRLVVHIEQQFDITFEDDELLLDHLKTIRIISKNIQSKTGGEV